MRPPGLQQWTGFLGLLRPPNLFTAIADPVAGLLIARSAGLPITGQHCSLVLASGSMYLAGLALNDYCDRHVDAVERPARPIPSGAVSAGAALRTGAVLLLAGLVIAAQVGGASLATGLALAATIIAYDAGVKRTPLGPIAMGACRALNLLLGLSVSWSLPGALPGSLPAGPALPPVAIGGPLLLGLYVAGLTYLARDEVQGNSARRARTALAFLAALGTGAVLALLVHPPASAGSWLWVAGAVALAVRVFAPVWHHHDPRSTGRAIGHGILLIPVIDAALCAVAGEPLWAAAVAGLAMPALVLRRWFSPT
jgi:4-hydroxybenzoate polyprenyltransferase